MGIIGSSLGITESVIAKRSGAGLRLPTIAIVALILVTENRRLIYRSAWSILIERDQGTLFSHARTMPEGYW